MAGVTRLLLYHFIPKCLIKIQRLMSEKLQRYPEILDLPTSQHGLYSS